jgi:branched-chain amino acid transport system substrate-binding protein
VSTWSCAIAAGGANSLNAGKMAKALGGTKLPPEVGLTPDAAFYRAQDHQLIASLYVGNAQAGGADPEDLFNVTRVMRGVDAAGRVQDSPCKLVWPG